MKKFGVFIRQVASNWAGYVTGGFLVALILVYTVWTDQQVPKVVAVALFALALLMACFKAWEEQYSQNQAASGAGALALVKLERETARQVTAVFHDVRLVMVLLNVSDSLIEFRTDIEELSMDHYELTESFPNDQVCILPRKLTQRVSLPPFGRVDMRKPHEGRLAYRVTYKSKGREAEHHSEAMLDFRLEQDKVTYRTITQNED